jgi:two-component system, cell cycle sensor histidine kinase and response regulator CckA
MDCCVHWVPTDVMASSTDVKTILFADDDGQIRQFIAAVLRSAGYAVIVASDGIDALKKAQEFEGTIHLLLSDIEMPGMSGTELAVHLSKERPDTKVLLLSGVANGLAVPDDSWKLLPKPFVPETLRDSIWGCLSSPRTVPNG